MSYTLTIVCLANSRKPPSGRCIAGRLITDTGFGEWIRPVSGRPTREISEEERRYADGRDPSVLDVIAIPMIRPLPDGHQQENHVIDDGYHWGYGGKVSWSQLQHAVEDCEGPLWRNSGGRNDRVPESQATLLSRSLYLARPDSLTMVVRSEAGQFGSRRRVRAAFELEGHSYQLVVTDPVVERSYLANKDGEYELKDALLCLSLAEVLKDNGNAFKLVAAVITPDRASET